VVSAEDWNMRAKKHFLFDRQARKNTLRQQGSSSVKRHTGTFYEHKAARSQLYKDELVRDMIKTMGNFKFGSGRDNDEKFKGIVSSRRLSPPKNQTDSQMNTSFVGSWGIPYPAEDSKHYDKSNGVEKIAEKLVKHDVMLSLKRDLYEQEKQDRK